MLPPFQEWLNIFAELKILLLANFSIGASTLKIRIGFLLKT